MLLSASTFLLGCTFATFADGQADSKGCCQKKNVPGSMPMSGNYILTEHRNGLPNDCKDGCVYMKENSGKVEYCFRPSSTYTAQCQDKVTTSGQTCWDTCELVAHEFSQHLIKNIENDLVLLDEQLCPGYLDPTKCADLPTIWRNFASTFWKAFYDRSLADLDGTHSAPSGWTNFMYHCGELHCGSLHGVPLPCENCTRSMKASIDLLIYPTTLDAINKAHLDSGFCNALGEHCPEILELILKTGLPLLADQSIPADVEQVCDASKTGTCTGNNEELYVAIVSDSSYKSCWGDCTSLVNTIVEHLTSERIITEQQDILVERLCSGSDESDECRDNLPDMWQSLAFTFWPNFYKKAVNETEYGSPSGRTISLFNCAELHCGEDSFTCDTCTSSIKASIDFLMSFASDEIVMGGLLETLGWVCESSQQREFCTELLSLLLTDGIQHLAAEVLPDDYVEVCNAATSGTCN